MNITLQSNNEEHTLAIAEALARHLQHGDVIALHGHLGAGKTRFVRGLARGLGVNESDVSSPTFVLMHEYPRDDGSRFIHIDAYRIQHADELIELGFNETLEQRADVVVIEWAQRVPSILPEERIDITITHIDELKRALKISLPRGLNSRLDSIHAVLEH